MDIPLEKLLGMEVEDFQKYSHLITLEPYKTTSLQIVKDAIAKYHQVNTTDWFIRALLIAGGILVLVVVVVVCCVCSQTKSIRGMQSVLTKSNIAQILLGANAKASESKGVHYAPACSWPHQDELPSDDEDEFEDAFHWELKHGPANPKIMEIVSADKGGKAGRKSIGEYFSKSGAPE